MPVVHLTTDSSPNSGLASSELLLGRIARLHLRPALDAALDGIWGAAFALIEAAEASIDGGSHGAGALDSAGDDLWGRLEDADRLYCELARICDALAPKTAGRG